MTLSLVTTADGSSTIRNNLTGDTYHSIYGAIQESQHVFIKHGLEYFIQLFQKKKIKILEVGLGTALNALLTFQFMKDLKSDTEYVALEPYPLEKTIYSNLNYGSGAELLLKFHEYPWESSNAISQGFLFTKHQVKLESIELPPSNFDIVYFDAFAPNSQPELWTQEVFTKMKSCMSTPSVLTTYCAKGEVRRALKSAGFNVDRLPGPPGKREMIRATLGQFNFEK